MNERYYETDYGNERGCDDTAGRRFRSEASGLARGRFSGRPERFDRPEPMIPPSDNRRETGGAGGTVIYSPSTLEDVKLLIDHLKLREQVIVDFSDVDQAVVNRTLDFMSGAIYALSGSIQRINTNIFLFAPSGVTITVPPHLGKRN